MDNPEMFDLMPPLLRNKKDVLFGNMAEIYEFHSKYVIAELNFIFHAIIQRAIYQFISHKHIIFFSEIFIAFS